MYFFVCSTQNECILDLPFLPVNMIQVENAGQIWMKFGINVVPLVVYPKIVLLSFLQSVNPIW
jgi:hypothetical protein